MYLSICLFVIFVVYYKNSFLFYLQPKYLAIVLHQSSTIPAISAKQFSLPQGSQLPPVLFLKINSHAGHQQILINQVGFKFLIQVEILQSEWCFWTYIFCAITPFSFVFYLTKDRMNKGKCIISIKIVPLCVFIYYPWYAQKFTNCVFYNI